MAVAVGGITAIATQNAAAAVSLDTSAYYVLVNANSGKALDLWQWSTADGGEFRQYTRTDGYNQQFQFAPSGGGNYRLKNRHSGKVVDVWRKSTQDGAEIRQYTDRNAANQQFSVAGSDNDHVTFTNRNSGKVLEVWGQSTQDGARVSQNSANGSAAQTWRLVKVGSGGSSSGSSGLVGWATQNGGTTGGSSGPTVNVSTAADFLSAIKSSTAQTVRLTANITLSGMNMVSSNKTIIGSGSGRTITGGGLNISGQKNIVVRNLSFTGWGDDAINIQSGATNVWIDHCSFSNGYDGAVDIKRGSDFITVSWNRTFQHDKTMLLGHSDGNGSEDVGHLRVTYHHNWFDRTTQRHPRVRFGNPVHVFNNYYVNNSGYGVASTENAGVLVEGNYFEGVRDPYHRGEGSSDPGNLVARNNYLVSSGAGDAGGSVAAIPYGYTLDQASSVKSIVTGGAGVGHLNL